MIKTSWGKISSGIKAYGTSATDLATMWAASSAGSFKASETTKPDATTMYTLTDETGAVWGLEAMHISTKDIRLWTWISLWWSKASIKDSDFGSDRPTTVYAKWPALANYKMCVTTHYDEKDSDPASAYRSSDKTKSLGDAFDKLKSLSGGAQWCANPYLETTFAKGNCIGCHQGAGVNFDITAVKKNRENGIPDFVYGFDSIKAAIQAENAKK
jgi:hypothetical protein